jgi:elongation factor G
VFVNKLDRERASFDRTYEALRARYGEHIEPLELPIGEEGEFHGVADVLTETAYVYDSGSAEQAEVPPRWPSTSTEVHDEVVEAIVVGDDQLLERFLEGDEPSLDELERTLMHELVDLTAFPVLEGAATTPIGVDRLCDYLCEIGPSPADRPPDAGAGGRHRGRGRTRPGRRPPGLRVQDRGRPLRRADLGVQGAVGHHPRRRPPGQPPVRHRRASARHLRAAGRQAGAVTEVVAGDIAAVSKLSGTETGDTLAAPRPARRGAGHRLARTGARRGLVPAPRPTRTSWPGAIARLRQEDPVLVLDHIDETHQTLLRGTGDTHLSVTLERLARKFGVEVDTEPVRVAYRETITKPGRGRGALQEAVGRPRPVRGGEPRARAHRARRGVRVRRPIVGGAIPRQFIPAVERGVADTMAEGGVVKGYPVVDVRARCVDGKAHSVDSSEMSFRAAGRLAFREAMEAGRPRCCSNPSRRSSWSCRPSCRAT